MPKAKPVPDGFHTITPYLIVDNAGAAIDFYKNAFNAREIMRMPGPDGRVMHAELQIGDSRAMMAEASPQMGARSPKTLGGPGVTLFLYVEDVDAWFKRAVDTGAAVLFHHPLCFSRQAAPDLHGGRRAAILGHEQAAEQRAELDPLTATERE